MLEPEQVERAMARWHAGALRLGRHRAPGGRADDEGARARLLARLRAYPTLPALVVAYRDGRASAEHAGALAAAGRTASGRVLDQAIVEAAAYWARALEVALGRRGPP